jgi:hypothetical protein
MPIIDVRAHSIAEGKRAEAVDFLKKIVQYHNSNGIKARLAFPINGDMSKLITEAEYESLGAMEEHIGAFIQSETWTEVSKDLKILVLKTDRHQYRIID